MTPMDWIIFVLCVIGVASLIYGICRKFTRMGWLAWQLPLIFLLTFTVRLIPVGVRGGFRFALALLIVFCATAAVLGCGALIRLFMHKKRLPAHPAWRVVDRILGGITALWDYFIIVLVLASAALPFCYYVADIPETDFLFQSPVWGEYFATCAFDFFLVAIFALSIRTGWRVGLARTVVIFLMMALTFGSLVFAIWLAATVRPFTLIAANLASSFQAGAFSAIIGTAIVAAVLFVLLFIVVCLLGWLMVALIRAIRFSYFWGTLDGFLGALLGFAIAVLVFVGLFFCVQALETNGLTALLEQIRTSLGESGEMLKDAFSSLQSFADLAEEWGHAIHRMLVASPLSEALMAIVA